MHYSPRGKVQERTVGEIHLHEFGAGIFAHELQHFIFHWCELKKRNANGEDFEERIACLAGDLTVQFWNKFYHLHPEYKTQKVSQ